MKTLKLVASVIAIFLLSKPYLGVGQVKFKQSVIAQTSSSLTPAARAEMVKKTLANLEGAIKGEHLKAFLVAYRHFQRIPRLAKRKKRLENYTFDIGENNKYYFVMFLPKHKPGKIEANGGENDQGRQVLYTIRKRDFRLVRYEYFM